MSEEILTMDRMRSLLSQEFWNIGYSISFSGVCSGHFSMSKYHGEFEMKSANVKRLEITVYANGNKDEFTVPLAQGSSGTYASKRFGKRASAIPQILEWLATVTKSHKHLHMMMHPETEIPQPFTFVSGDKVLYGNSVYPGTLQSVSVEEIVATSGLKVTTQATLNPNSKPYFLVEINQNPLRGHQRHMNIVTDGEIWYPTIETQFRGTDVRRIFSDPSDNTLPMNHADRELISYAISLFCEEFCKHSKEENE